MIKRRKSDDFFFRLLEYELIDFRGGEDEKKISLKRAKKCSMDNFFIKAAVGLHIALTCYLFIIIYLIGFYWVSKSGATTHTHTHTHTHYVHKHYLR